MLKSLENREEKIDFKIKLFYNYPAAPILSVKWDSLYFLYCERLQHGAAFTHALIKKSQKMPAQDFDLAKRRRNEIRNR